MPVPETLLAANGTINVEAALACCGYGLAVVRAVRCSIGLGLQENVAVVSEKLQELLKMRVSSSCIRDSTLQLLAKLGVTEPVENDMSLESLHNEPCDLWLRQQLSILLNRPLSDIGHIRLTSSKLPSLIDLVRVLTGMAHPRTSETVTALTKKYTTIAVNSFKFPGPGQRPTPIPMDKMSLVQFIFQLLPLETVKRTAVARLFLIHTGCDESSADHLICTANGNPTQNLAAAEESDGIQEDAPEDQLKTNQESGSGIPSPGAQVIMHLARENVADLYLGFIGPERRKTSGQKLENDVVFRVGKTQDVARRYAQLARYFTKEGCSFDVAVVWKGCGDLEKSLQNHLARHRFYGFKGQREIFCASGLGRDQIFKTTMASVELLRAQSGSCEPPVKRCRTDSTEILNLEKEKTAQETEKTKQVEAVENTRQVEAAEKTKQVEAAERTKQLAAEASEKTKRVEAAARIRQSELQNERLKLLADKGATVEQLLSLLTSSAECS